MKLLPVLALLAAAAPVAAADPWATEAQAALAKAGANRPQLERALADVPAAQRAGMAFLVANMPDRDLTALSADFLLTNVRLAYQARADAPWGADIPEDVFLNAVLPYANLDERRDDWRAEFVELCRPIVRGCKAPTEATMRLNAELFPRLNLKYSTKRKAPNQSPRESIAQGLASCTGLSVVLADACRAVGVPARVVGTPLWANKRGNHTWVEVWDRGWHFTGACEPDPVGLDRGWFVGDAAQAVKGSPQHAIFAASFRRTGLHFPLVWAKGSREVPAEDVTDRYAKPAARPADTARVLVRVVDAAGRRVAVRVTAMAADDPAAKAEGTSRGETADANDLLGFDLRPDRAYIIRTAGAEKSVRTGPAGREQVVELVRPAD
ncbi:MAG: transglutaminase-like domain-containing protein [Gemmataceae bacterium]